MELEKGQKIKLPKPTENTLSHFCIGVNWGAIELSSWFSQKQKKVDLDLSCLMLNAKGELVDYVYSTKYKSEYLDEYGLGEGKFRSEGGAIFHTGDDLTGDVAGNDGLDNETIVLDLPKVDTKIDQIIFFINSISEEDFSDIPFLKVRMYEGDVNYGRKVFAQFDIAPNATIDMLRALILGKLSRQGNEWVFEAIIEGTQDDHIALTITRILDSYHS